MVTNADLQAESAERLARQICDENMPSTHFYPWFEGVDDQIFRVVEVMDDREVPEHMASGKALCAMLYDVREDGKFLVCGHAHLVELKPGVSICKAFDGNTRMATAELSPEKIDRIARVRRAALNANGVRMS